MTCAAAAAHPAVALHRTAPPPQIWAGSKQKELGLGSMQLLHQYVPLAAGLLAILVSSSAAAVVLVPVCVV